MRIIAGTHRSRKLLGPADAETTRPITDRVKTSLFDRLMSMGRLDGARVVDVFSGTGSMGLESLSRGAEKAWFVDRDRTALDRLRKNIDTLGENEFAQVLAVDALGGALVMALMGKVPTLVFFDPPYAMVRDPRKLERCSDQVTRLAEVADEDALLVWRTPDDSPPPTELSGWGQHEAHEYGSMTLHVYRRADQ